MMKIATSATKLRVFYLLALGILAALSITTHFVLGTMNKAMINDGTVINIAGRQRMLSQRIGSQGLQLQTALLAGDSTLTEAVAKNLESSLDLWVSSHEGLLNRDSGMGFSGENSDRIKAAYRDVDADVRAVKIIVDNLLYAARGDTTATGPAISAGIGMTVVAYGDAFLPRMNDIVSLHEAELARKIENVQRAETFAYFSSLLVLALVSLFMFEPAIRRLSQQSDDLETLKEAIDSHTLYSVADIHGHIVDINEGYCKLSGYSREELIGQPHSILNSGHHPREFWKEMWRTIASGKAWREQVCNRAKDGSLYWVDSTNVPQFNREGQIERYISWRFDITEQKRAEQEAEKATRELEDAKHELDAQHEELQSILDGIPGLVFYKDDQNNILDCNASAARYVGKPREDIRGRPTGDFFTAEEAEFHQADDRAVLESGKPSLGNVREYDLDGGTHVHMRLDKVPLLGENGRPDRVVLIATDVSDLQSAKDKARQAEERLNSALVNSNTGLWDWNVVTGETYFNDTWYTQLGYEPGELPMAVDTWGQLVHPDDLNEAMSDIQAHFDGASSIYRNEHRLQQKDGNWHWIRDVGKVVERDDEGRPLRMVGVHIDIQALRDAVAQTESFNEELRESQERFELALEGSRDAIFDWNIQAGRIHLSPRWRELLDDPSLELIASRTSMLGHIASMDIHRVKRALTRFIVSKNSQFELEFQMMTGTGKTVWVLMRAAAVRDEKGAATRLSGSIADFTSMKEAEEELKRLVQQDTLTGLASRTRFIDALERAFSRSKRSQKILAVLFFDFDRFKAVNDSLGHDAGDELLISISERLRANVRDVDTAARFGGDEFVILLEDLPDTATAKAVADKLLKACAKSHSIRGHTLVSTASIGLVTNETTDGGPAELLRFADAAMYEAKRRGRNCVVEFDSEMFNEQLDRLALEEDMQSAASNNELSVVYQSILDLNDGSIVAAEALLRWSHPTRGPIPPDMFIPIAEESGQIVTVGGWALETACRQLADWRRRGVVHEDFAISVNMSKTQVLMPGFVDFVTSQIDRHKLPRKSIKLEVTETTVVDNRADVGDVLQRLRDQGIRVMMDDFGTGHSSLSGLHMLPIDELKIDRSFVRSAGQNTDMIAITSSIVTLADHLSLQTIGEGIESPDHVALLQSMGCNYGQGFLFSRPIPPEEFETMILDRQGPSGTTVEAN
ncbi:MAG: EAL domain-containing protein [Pseudomonadota bacterium]